MGWGKSSSAGRTDHRLPHPGASGARRSARAPAAGGAGVLPLPCRQMLGALEHRGGAAADHAPVAGRARLPSRQRRALPVYDVATGQDLETPVNLDNTLLQVMFPDLRIALGQVPPPPPRSTPEQVEAHWQKVLQDLSRDLAGQEGLALDVATGARKEGRFMYTDRQVGRLVADTFEKIMAYGGLLASPCLRPPQLVEGVRVLVVKEGEMGTGDCAGKMSARLARLFGKDGSQAGQFRLGVRLDEDTVLVGKGTLKQMDWADVDENGQGYDLILPDSSFKGNQPAFGEHTWDVHLGFVAWSQERRTRLSYQALQWFDPELVEQCIFPRADAQIPVLLEAMKTSEGARQFLKIEREDREAEVQRDRARRAGGGRRPRAGRAGGGAGGRRDRRDDRPSLRAERAAPAAAPGLARPGRGRRGQGAVLHGPARLVPRHGRLAARGVHRLPRPAARRGDGHPLPHPHPARRADLAQRRLAGAAQAGPAGGPRRAGAWRRFFRYAGKHKGAVFMSHATAKRVGGDFDGDVFQLMPVTPHKPLAEIAQPQPRLVRPGAAGRPGAPRGLGRRRRPRPRSSAAWRPTSPPSGPRRSPTRTASGWPRRPSSRAATGPSSCVTWATTWMRKPLHAESREELAGTLADIAGDPARSLDEAVEIAEAHGFDAHAWIAQRERRSVRPGPQLQPRAGRPPGAEEHGLATWARSSTPWPAVNASQRFTPEEREQVILRLAEELQAEVDKFKYDTGANMEYVNAVRERVGRELVWLDVHKDPDVFARETEALTQPGRRLPPVEPRHAGSSAPGSGRRSRRSTSRTCCPPSSRRSSWPRPDGRCGPTTGPSPAPCRPRTRRRWSAPSRSWRAGAKPTPIPRSAGSWPRRCGTPPTTVDRPGATASAAFHAFRPEVLAQLATPQPRPMSEIVILGAHHENNLGPRSRVRPAEDSHDPGSLEDYTDAYGRSERRLAAYELGEDGRPAQRLGYLPKDAPRQTGPIWPRFREKRARSVLGVGSAR